jgi:hypothetical protein
MLRLPGSTYRTEGHLRTKKPLPLPLVSLTWLCSPHSEAQVRLSQRWLSTTELAPKANSYAQAAVVLALWKPQQTFSEIPICVVFRPEVTSSQGNTWRRARSTKVPHCGLWQTGSSSGSSRGSQGQGLQQGSAHNRSVCAAAPVSLPPSVLISCSQLEAVMSSSSQGHQLTQLIVLLASRSSHVPTPPSAVPVTLGLAWMRMESQEISWLFNFF